MGLPLVDVGVPLASPEAGPKPTKSLRFRHDPLSAPEEQRRALAQLGFDFAVELGRHGFGKLQPATLEIFQINLGKLCNMTCRHCHVDAGPDRVAEMMSREIIDACFAALDRTSAHTVDITGGAPELHPEFEDVVEMALARGKRVIDRSNLTVLLLPRRRHLPDWLAERGVQIIASLPHYRQRMTDAQRGDQTFSKSMEALRRLNAVGYGRGNPRMQLHLMTNPVGAFLAGNQESLERDWKTILAREQQVAFDRLYALNNMPISRFLEWLTTSGNLESYMNRLKASFNPAAIAPLMCRNTVSVGWDGRVYDCDFNQMLEIPSETPSDIRHLDTTAFSKRSIRTAAHCYGCTAGAGSSCGGATT